MGHPFAVGEQLTKAMPPDVMGKGVPLPGIYDPTYPRYGEGKEFRDLRRPPSRTCRRSSRPPRASRGSSASGGCTRPASS